MRLYEKILVLAIIIALCLRGDPYISTDTQFGITGFTLFITSVSYLIEGYWLFRKDTEKLKVLSIIAGIALCPSVYYLHLLIEFRINESFEIFLLPNQLLFLYVGCLLLFKRKTLVEKASIRGIFIRSGIVAVFTAFLYYVPTKYMIYRDVQSFLNSGNKSLQNNLKMIDYYERYNVDSKNGDWDKALSDAEIANKYGKLWISIDTNEQNPPIDSVQYISGTYEKLYQAYKCKAYNEFAKSDFRIALIDYINARKAIYYGAYQASGYDTLYYMDCNTLLEEAMALCYSNLQRYRNADSLFDKAIHEYGKLPDKKDSVLAKWYNDFAISIEHQRQYTGSIQLLRIALEILQKDSAKNKINILQNYYYMAQNYIALDSIDKAKILLQKIAHETPAGDELHCSANLYYGACLYKLDKFNEADSVISSALDCLKSIDSVSLGVSAAYYSLANVKVVLGKYAIALQDVENGRRISIKASGTASMKYDLLVAFIYRTIADYQRAEENYNMIINNASASSTDVTGVKVQLAHLYVITGKLDMAKTLSDEAISPYSFYMHTVFKLTYAEYFDELAYVHYCLGDYKTADTLYEHVITACNMSGKQKSSYMAIALNGLGLVATVEKKYKKADTLFSGAETLHLEIFGKNNPYTALLYLNYGILKTLEGDYINAHKMLGNASTIDAIFFEPTHDIFGDIDVAKGNLYLKERNIKDACSSYETALNIYLNKFGKDYYKVISLQKLLKQL